MTFKENFGLKMVVVGKTFMISIVTKDKKLLEYYTPRSGVRKLDALQIPFVFFNPKA